MAATRAMLTPSWCEISAREIPAQIVYRAGGRFLIVAPFDAEWEAKTERLRADIAGWAFGQFHGEVVFHLAAVE